MANMATGNEAQSLKIKLTKLNLLDFKKGVTAYRITFDVANGQAAASPAILPANQPPKR